MDNMLALFSNRVLGTAVLAWFIAQVMKVVIVSIVARKIMISRMLGMGGMPSSHAAFVVAMAMAVGFRVGFDSAVFALSAALAIVVMYDAQGVRRAAGIQARLLNRIVVEVIEEGRWPQHQAVKELLGHTPVEVFAGAALGAVIAVIRG